jgi:hypothetical protein
MVWRLETKSVIEFIIQKNYPSDGLVPNGELPPVNYLKTTCFRGINTHSLLLIIYIYIQVHPGHRHHGV